MGPRLSRLARAAGGRGCIREEWPRSKQAAVAGRGASSAAAVPGGDGLAAEGEGNAAPSEHEALPAGALPSLYQRRVARLAAEALASPPAESLQETLRACISFCYGVTRDWAPHVRVTVFADKVSEHQFNVPVYETLLVTWSVPGAEALEVRCVPVAGTDVSHGLVCASPFWSRTVAVDAVGESRRVTCRAMAHQLLYWFVSLEDADARKQHLVNMIVQLHEACFNCIGRHKEVFEYCLYDLVDAEAAELEEPAPAAAASAASRAAGSAAGPAAGAPSAAAEAPGTARPLVVVPTPVPAPDADAAADGAADGVPNGAAGSRRAVGHFSAAFLDRQKRAALHGAILSPLKFLFQKRYEVFENIDSHGASFWAAIMAESFFPGLELPFESILDLDSGWTWGAVDFLPALRGTVVGREALSRFAALENLGRDWRSVAAGLQPPPALVAERLPGLALHGCRGFRQVVRDARRPGNPLRAALAPYAARFAELLQKPVLLRRWALLAASSDRWEGELGPALSELARRAGHAPEAAAPSVLRARLCGCGAAAGEAALAAVDAGLAAELLGAAGVAWAA